MQNLENLDVFEVLITQKLLKCLKDPFLRSALNYKSKDFLLNTMCMRIVVILLYNCIDVKCIIELYK